MYANYSFLPLIGAIDGSDVPKTRKLLGQRGLLMGPRGIIDTNMDYHVYRAVVESSMGCLFVDLFAKNDQRTIPQLSTGALT